MIKENYLSVTGGKIWYKIAGAEKESTPIIAENQTIRGIRRRWQSSITDTFAEYSLCLNQCKKHLKK